ncbi:hypothetical protein KsCSTR_25790 [Candidatus Kuenenia stuttgartiensis]|uniref:Uncharacterized protein n=1 Tax=Kuenenia stuttgartiensis TaxID=174633 RepID=A0A6G7GRY1_KUEST|nr:hypothetical protein KsCSTR_25790 [Candidatus Kuenenia stuttgartiensis]
MTEKGKRRKNSNGDLGSHLNMALQASEWVKMSHELTAT